MSTLEESTNAPDNRLLRRLCHRRGESHYSCPLTLGERGQEFARLFVDAEEIVELADGYSLRFPNCDSWITQAVELVIAERTCCPFFGFTLAFEADGGPVWLHIVGPGEVKTLIWELLVPAHLRPTVRADRLGT